MKRAIKRNSGKVSGDVYTTLLIVVALLFGILFSKDYIYAKSVVNGNLNISTEKITYEYDGISIPNTLPTMSKETLVTLLNGNKSKILNFDYFIGNSRTATEDILNNVKNGILTTGLNSRVEIGAYTSSTMNLT